VSTLRAAAGQPYGITGRGVPTELSAARARAGRLARRHRSQPAGHHQGRDQRPVAKYLDAARAAAPEVTDKADITVAPSCCSGPTCAAYWRARPKRGHSGRHPGALRITEGKTDEH
jgi:hypothetical protein